LTASPGGCSFARSFDLPGSEKIPKRQETNMASKKKAKKPGSSKSRLKQVKLKPVKTLTTMGHEKWIEVG